MQTPEAITGKRVTRLTGVSVAIMRATSTPQTPAHSNPIIRNLRITDHFINAKLRKISQSAKTNLGLTGRSEGYITAFRPSFYFLGTGGISAGLSDAEGLSAAGVPDASAPSGVAEASVASTSSTGCFSALTAGGAISGKQA